MTLSLASASVAVTVPTAVAFSATLKASPLLNVGASFATVVAVAEADHALVPSAFVACTCTWWAVPAVRPVTAMLGSVPLWPALVHGPLVPSRYCTA